LLSSGVVFFDLSFFMVHPYGITVKCPSQAILMAMTFI
jgi:hypothetical protein